MTKVILHAAIYIAMFILCLIMLGQTSTIISKQKTVIENQNIIINLIKK